MKKGQQPYISRVHGGVTPVGSVMKLGTVVELPDVINRARFHLDWMSFFVLARVKIWGFPFEMHMALTTLPCSTVLSSDRPPVHSSSTSTYSDIIALRPIGLFFRHRLPP
jgi:hypothetical protein